MRVRVGAATDIGQVREGNEDAYLVEAPLYAVADGMGGHKGGEVASGLAIDTLHRRFLERREPLAENVNEANRVVFERSMSDRSVAGMGTTLTAALIDDDRARVAHVGDSRAYLLRDGDLSLLTEDHTLVHRMVMSGEITPEEAEVHPHRSILTRVVGMEGRIEVDEVELALQPGDRVLLCTDGLTGMLDEETIGRILASEGDPQAAADRLVEAANRAGGVDNITALVLDLAEGEDPPVDTSTPVERGAAAPAAPSRPAGPAARISGRRVRRIPLWGGLALAVVVIGLVGLRLFPDTQWFVGVSNGHVAVYRGIPAEVAGFELHHVVVETEIPAADAESLALYRDLPDGITADDRASAEAIVREIRHDLSRPRSP